MGLKFDLLWMSLTLDFNKKCKKTIEELTVFTHQDNDKHLDNRECLWHTRLIGKLRLILQLYVFDHLIHQGGQKSNIHLFCWYFISSKHITSSISYSGTDPSQNFETSSKRFGKFILLVALEPCFHPQLLCVISSHSWSSFVS